MLYALALLAGVVAGSRTFTAPAAVSWAARLGALNLEGSWLAFMGYSWTPWIFTALAILEMVGDQLPSTPSRKVPMQFGARIVSGALSGATIGSSAGSWIAGVVAGVDRRGDRNLGRRGDTVPHGEGVRERHAGSLHRGRRRNRSWASLSSSPSDEVAGLPLGELKRSRIVSCDVRPRLFVLGCSNCQTENGYCPKRPARLRATPSHRSR